MHSPRKFIGISYMRRTPNRDVLFGYVLPTMFTKSKQTALDPIYGRVPKVVLYGELIAVKRNLRQLNYAIRMRASKT